MQLGLHPAPLRLSDAKTKAIQLRSAIINGEDPFVIRHITQVDIVLVEDSKHSPMREIEV